MIVSNEELSFDDFICKHYALITSFFVSINLISKSNKKGSAENFAYPRRFAYVFSQTIPPGYFGTCFAKVKSYTI